MIPGPASIIVPLLIDEDTEAQADGCLTQGCTVNGREIRSSLVTRLLLQKGQEKELALGRPFFNPFKPKNQNNDHDKSTFYQHSRKKNVNKESWEDKCMF